MKIDEIANKNCGLWELMNWVKRRRLPVIEAIQYNGHLCIELDDLWNAIHRSFNLAQDHYIEYLLLKEISNKETII